MKKIIAFSGGIVLIIVLLAVLGSYYFFQREAKKALPIKSGTMLEIKNGASALSIAENLESEGILEGSDKTIFRLLAQIYRKKINTGFYQLEPNMSMVDVLDKIDKHEYKTIKITIPEGWRTEQIAERISENGLCEYEEFIDAAKGLEGKLFPDTYLFNPRMRAIEIVAKMIENYENRVAGLNVTEEDLIIASIVEREAINDTERPIIAGIYRNRLSVGMKMEADPTVQYGKDNLAYVKLSAEAKKSFKFWQPIKLADYQTVKSEYNTYLIPATPPNPISNPGLASIKFTQNYARHNYYYFIQTGGKIYPAKTLQEHDANRAKYLGAKL
jgi:UPF0755 protein